MSIRTLHIGLIFVFASCSEEALNPLEGMIGLPDRHFPEIDYPTDNMPSVERQLLGKMLFYDVRLSTDSSISCARCHKQEYAFSDNMAFSFGVKDRIGVRNSPSIANVAYHPYFTRDGGVPTLEMQILVPIQEHNEFAFNIVEIENRLSSDSLYQALSWAAYGRDFDGYVLTRALANFERSITSTGSKFDLYYFYGQKDALNQEESKGMQIFYSDRGKCYSCHSGFNFTNYGFENNGLYIEYDDPGRMRLTSLDADKALFKVPSLRNIELTAPYMHDGSVQTLKEVIEHYSTGIVDHQNKRHDLKPLHFTEKEKEQIISFLLTLTDHELVNNTDFKNE